MPFHNPVTGPSRVCVRLVPALQIPLMLWLLAPISEGNPPAASPPSFDCQVFNGGDHLLFQVCRRRLIHWGSSTDEMKQWSLTLEIKVVFGIVLFCRVLGS